MKQIEITIDPKKKQVTFPVPSIDFIPDYLKYLLQYYKIPDTFKLIFTDKTFKNLKEMRDEKT